MTTGLPARSYYQDAKDSFDTVRYRTAGKQVVQEFLENLRGATYDEHGRFKSYDESLKLINDIGLRAIKSFLESASSQITSLSNYAGEDRIHRHISYLAKGLAKQIVLYGRDWEVKNKDFLQLGCEKIMFDTMLKAKEGFENNNISKSWYVSENIEQTPPRQEGVVSGFRGLFGSWRK